MTKGLKFLLVSLGCVSLLLSPGLASADVNDFTVMDFSAEETLSRRDPQGELRVVERINVDFQDFNHGILRAIPSSYKRHSLQLHINRVSSDSGAPTQYSTYTSNGNTVLKIGDPDRTLTGPQEYTIDYTLRNVIGFYNDHDELYWDVNGDQWQQPFNHVSVVLHLPVDVQQNRTPLCFAGSFGSTEHNCTVSSDGPTMRTETTSPLTANQTLTYVTGFDKGYFRPSTWQESIGEYWRQITGVVLPIILLGGGSGLYWWRRGRDARGSGIIVPQYDAPDEMKPLAVGGLVDFKVDNRDITATIIDLAVRGYLKIIETKKNKLIGKDKLSYKLQLLKPDFSQLDAEETVLLSALFSTPVAGAETDISASKNKLYTAATTIKKNVKTSLKSDGYLRNDSLKSGRGWRAIVKFALIVIINCIIVFIAKNAAFIIGSGIGLLIALLFMAALDARTAKGVAAREHIMGLKRYLEVAEKDRLQKLQAPDAKYAAGAGEPVKTVDLYEKLLPYAMVLGVEQQWSKQFESLYISPPDWYSGNWGTFNVVYLASSLNDGVGAAVNTAFTAPSSSGSSGFSGGSSGGGGGGGGGGW